MASECAAEDQEPDRAPAVGPRRLWLGKQREVKTSCAPGTAPLPLVKLPAHMTQLGKELVSSERL